MWETQHRNIRKKCVLLAFCRSKLQYSSKVVHQPFGQTVPCWHKLGTITPLHKIFRRGNEWKVVKRWEGVRRNRTQADAERQFWEEEGENECRKVGKWYSKRKELKKRCRTGWTKEGLTWEIWMSEEDKRCGWHKRSKVRLKWGKERKPEKGVQWRKRGVMFHFSSTNHQRKPTTGLPVGQDCWSGSLCTHTHTYTQCELDPFHLLPSQTVLLMVKTAEGIPMSKTNE